VCARAHVSVCYFCAVFPSATFETFLPVTVYIQASAAPTLFIRGTRSFSPGFDCGAGEVARLHSNDSQVEIDK
jgi:hypothetical protein